MPNTTSLPPAFPSANLKWTLTQIHATAFIIAWFFCVTVSILVARYTRRSQSTLVSPCFWFQAHKILNFFALTLMVLGLITIFIAHQWSWLGPKVGGGYRNGSSTAWHTLFGILSVVLAFIQPLNAYLRCEPQHSKRQIFNWIHRSVGLLSWIFAATCIAIACKWFTKRFTNGDAAFAICLTIIIGTTLFVVFMEILEKKQEIKIGRYAASNADVTIKCSSSRLSLSHISLIVFVCILLSLVLPLCFMILVKPFV